MSKEYLLRKNVNAFKCLRCNHIWIPKVDMKELETEIKIMPKTCPNCKSPYWDSKKKKTKDGKEKKSGMKKNLNKQVLKKIGIKK
jgi:hypothetical protein